MDTVSNYYASFSSHKLYINLFVKSNPWNVYFSCKIKWLIICFYCLFFSIIIKIYFFKSFRQSCPLPHKILSSLCKTSTNFLIFLFFYIHWYHDFLKVQSFYLLFLLLSLIWHRLEQLLLLCIINIRFIRRFSSALVLIILIFILSNNWIPIQLLQ